MNSIKELLKIYFKQASGISEIAYMTKKGRVGPILTSILKLIVKFIMGIVFFFLALALGIISNVFGFPEARFENWYFYCFLIMLVEGFSLFFNMFIEDKNTELIIPMPIKTSHIIYSKFIYTLYIIK
ncbi:hypothetical protein AZF37_04280 [endosymbiont 'TC1' of Trimyema compressum]|uniref:hypothetical protein n=1 Tax=endosymbiont 'TC1' of Trimyema compressum TaxID=243899 RepID=UPI0007F058A6|nr:hypothetical protein [endosymbiont 'TC1' of Trimyema compressum]AMP20486.1 hypothetical protein AZF37_04280 [endosymbiont 'TC1' of Trimyema compressum]